VDVVAHSTSVYMSEKVEIIILSMIAIGLSLMVWEVVNSRPQPESMTKQEIVLECEKLSAVATNEAWSYKNCIDNITNPNDAKELIV